MTESSDGQNPSEIHIAYIADMKVLYPALVSMMSALESTKSKVIVHFFGRELDPLARKFLDRAISLYSGSALRYYEVSDITGSSFDRKQRIPLPTMMTLLHMPNFLQGRVLYLDCDTLVHGNIANLFGEDMCGSPIGAVQCFVMLFDNFTRIPGDLDGRDRHEIRLMAPFTLNDRFNSGVLLFDTEVIRSAEMTTKITANMGLKEDQPVLNHHFRGAVHWLDPSWNVAPGLHHLYPRLRRGMRATADAPDRCDHHPPKITHFLGAAKPWHSFSVEDLKKDFQGTREDLAEKLGLDRKDDFVFLILKNEMIIEEYIGAVKVWRKSASRFMAYIGLALPNWDG